MEKRVVFNNRVLPYLLVAPQLLITVVFFLWPASPGGAASRLSARTPSASAPSSSASPTSRPCSVTPRYLNSLKVTAVFCVAVAVLALSMSLLMAVMADRVLRGSGLYRTLLIWPYAVAPAVAAVLWVFLFNPTVGIIAYMLQVSGYDWNYLLNGNQAMLLVVLAAAWKQISYNFLFFLAGPAGHPALADRGRRDRRRGARQAVLDHRLPAAVADHLLPARRQHRLCLLRHLRRHRRDHARAVRARPPTSWSTRSTRTASSTSTSAARRRSR